MHVAHTSVRWTHLASVVTVLCATSIAGCATNPAVLDLSGESIAYVVESDDAQFGKFAPIFVAEHTERSYNRIGTPSARINKRGREDVFVDPAKSTVYLQRTTFTGEGGLYTNLFYRVHFEKSPFTLIPFNASAGENVGLMVVVTLDETENPVWITTVQTCGCYHAVTPTSFLAASTFPEEWTSDPVKVYGEVLPGILEIPGPYSPANRLVVYIHGGTHRVKHIDVLPVEGFSARHDQRTMTSLPVEALKAIPLEDGTTSFYIAEGRKKGLVKGAFKPWEALIFGLWTQDLHVGHDREYGDSDKVGSLFYTTLNGRKKVESDMWHFARFLRHNGWRP